MYRFQRYDGPIINRVIRCLVSSGALHLFTGCGNGYGTVGIAWRGGMCDKRGYNTGEHAVILHLGVSENVVYPSKTQWFC